MVPLLELVRHTVTGQMYSVTSLGLFLSGKLSNTRICWDEPWFCYEEAVADYVARAGALVAVFCPLEADKEFVLPCVSRRHRIT